MFLQINLKSETIFTKNPVFLRSLYQMIFSASFGKVTLKMLFDNASL